MCVECVGTLHLHLFRLCITSLYKQPEVCRCLVADSNQTRTVTSQNWLPREEPSPSLYQHHFNHKGTAHRTHAVILMRGFLGICACAFISPPPPPGTEQFPHWTSRPTVFSIEKRSARKQMKDGEYKLNFSSFYCHKVSSNEDNSKRTE
jgi:hypothetical protein